MRALKLLGVALLLAAGAARAELSSTVAVVSDYDYRGFSQTSKDPALQASLDWSHASGLYATVWGTNVDFDTGSNVETDFIVGIAGGPEDGLGWDVGLIHYKYWPDDDDIDFTELYGKLAYGVGTVKLSYSDGFAGADESALYLEGSLDFTLPYEIALTLHAGWSSGDYWDALSEGAPDGDDAEYIDYSVAVSRTFGHFDLGLRYVDTETDRAFVIADDVLNNEGRLIFSVVTSFPWE